MTDLDTSWLAFLAAAGGGVVGALAGSALALLLESAKTHRKRRAVLDLVAQDIQIVVEGFRSLVKRVPPSNDAQEVAAFSLVFLHFRSSLEASTEWFSVVADTDARDSVMEFYRRLGHTHDLVRRFDTTYSQTRLWAEQAHAGVMEGAVGTVAAGERAAKALDRLIASIHWTDWMHALVQD